MTRFLTAVGLVAALAACTPAPAPEAPAPEAIAPAQTLEITDAWIAETPAGAPVAAGYLQIANPGAGADRLLAAATPRAGRVELHTMAMDGDMMVMRPVEAIDVAAGSGAVLKPGGDHLMLFDLTAPFVAGETVPLTLTFETAGEIAVTAQVRPRAVDGGAHGGGH